MTTKTDRRPTLDDLRAAQAEYDAAHPRPYDPIGGAQTDAEAAAWDRQRVANGIRMELLSIRDRILAGAQDDHDLFALLPLVARAQEAAIDRQMAEEVRMAADRNKPLTERELIDNAAQDWLTLNLRFMGPDVVDEALSLVLQRARLVKRGAKRAAIEDVQDALAAISCLPPAWLAETEAIS